MTADCVFCRRIATRDVDQEWRNVVAFSPLNPVTPGHLLVLPREHVADATENPCVTAETMRIAATVAGDVGNCNIITSVGAAATQTVPHLHLHVVPRRSGDGLALPWTGQAKPPPDTSWLTTPEVREGDQRREQR